MVHISDMTLMLRRRYLSRAATNGRHPRFGHWDEPYKLSKPGGLLDTKVYRSDTFRHVDSSLHHLENYFCRESCGSLFGERAMLKIAINKPSLSCAALAAVLAAAPLSLHWSPSKTLSLSLDRANARIGRPLSPGSIAGVNRRVYRRTARRAYYGYGGTAAIGAAGAYYGLARSNYGGGLYNYSPVATVTSHETTEGTDHMALDHGQYEYCVSRTFGAGPCQ